MVMVVGSASWVGEFGEYVLYECDVTSVTKYS